jgi:hypothetical protein
MSSDTVSPFTRIKIAIQPLMRLKIAVIGGMTGLALAASSPAINPTPVKPTFMISGILSSLLAPGATVAMDLSLTNPNRVKLTVTKLTAYLDGISGGLGNCTPKDFKIHQYSGDYAFTLAASATRSLGDLKIGLTQWPQLSMINLPVNQDGCKNATVAIRFSGEATETKG